MEKFLNFIKKYWKILLVIIVIIVIIVITHALLMLWDFKNPFKGNLVADWLGYFGSLIGAGVSIFGIYRTLQDNRRQLEKQREEERSKVEEQHRKEIMPFLSLSNTVFSMDKKLFSDFLTYKGYPKDRSRVSKFKSTPIRFDDNIEERCYFGFKVKNSGTQSGFINKIEVSIGNIYKEEDYSTSHVTDYKYYDYDGTESSVFLLTIASNEEKPIILELSKNILFKNNKLIHPLIVFVKISYEDLVGNQYYLIKEICINKLQNDKLEIKGLRDRRPELISK